MEKDSFHVESEASNEDNSREEHVENEGQVGVQKEDVTQEEFESRKECQFMEKQRFEGKLMEKEERVGILKEDEIQEEFEARDESEYLKKERFEKESPDKKGSVSFQKEDRVQEEFEAKSLEKDGFHVESEVSNEDNNREEHVEKGSFERESTDKKGGVSFQKEDRVQEEFEASECMEEERFEEELKYDSGEEIIEIKFKEDFKEDFQEEPDEFIEEVEEETDLEEELTAAEEDSRRIMKHVDAHDDDYDPLEDADCSDSDYDYKPYKKHGNSKKVNQKKTKDDNQKKPKKDNQKKTKINSNESSKKSKKKESSGKNSKEMPLKERKLKKKRKVNWRLLPSQFKCRLCKAMFSEQIGMKQHIVKAHSNQQAPMPKKHKDKVVKEKMMGKVDPSKVLADFEVSALSFFVRQCPTCNEYIAETTIATHLDTHAPSKVICEMCGAGFKNLSRLGEHKRNCQKVRTRIKCEVCGKEYLSKCSLYSHHRVHHVDAEKRMSYNCERCGKECRTGKALRDHIATHLTVKPFECPECGKGFAQKSNMNIHRRVHSGVKPYKCDMCQAAFSHNVSLKGHKKKQHGIDLWKK